MKTTKICPKCGKDDIFHSGCVMDRGDGNEAMCMVIQRSDPIEARDLGQFEVYVCRKCGFSEFYVINPTELKDVVDPQDES